MIIAPSKPIHDLDFDGFPTLREELGHAMHWLIIYPVAGLLSLYLAWVATSELLTYLNQDVLNNPRMVRKIDGNALILADGERVSFPMLKRVPGDALLFQSALRQGVEVDPKGNVYGLLSVKASCGNTLQCRSIKRINLSELAAVTKPECVDGEGIHPEELSFLRESGCYKYDRVNDLIYSCLRHWRDAFERAGSATHPDR